MSLQTYHAATAGGVPAEFRQVDPFVALSGLVAFGARIRPAAPEAAMAFLRHAEGLLRGTEPTPGVARTWPETVLFAECAVREAHKELQRALTEARATPAEGGVGVDGADPFGALRRAWRMGLSAAGTGPRELARFAEATGALLEAWPHEAPPQPTAVVRTPSVDALAPDACGCTGPSTFGGLWASVESPGPGAKRKRPSRDLDAAADALPARVAAVALGDTDTPTDASPGAAAAASALMRAEALVTEGDDLLDSGAPDASERAARMYHAACVRLEGVRCAGAFLSPSAKRDLAAELRYARRAAREHAHVVENCAPEHAAYDARDPDLRVPLTRQGLTEPSQCARRAASTMHTRLTARPRSAAGPTASYIVRCVTVTARPSRSRR
mmetsp:Transcript_3910/g.11547  ORF Transcript_3910/g.11547 Transcript_3910/m.11547 type:complete len:385 (-) Transcript_3910:882-2036(-)